MIYTLGLDFGTDSVRAVLVNADTGEIHASCVQNYKRWNEQFCCNAGEQRYRQHPLDYTEGLTAAVHGVMVGIKPDEVIGIGLDTTSCTVAPVDEKGIPLALHDEFSNDPEAMFTLWKDHTAIAEAEEITMQSKKAEKDYTTYTGGAYSCESFFSKILHHIRKNRKVREAAFSWVEMCDWIAAELTGNTDPLQMKRSRCTAGHKALWNKEWGGLPPDTFLSSVDPLLKGLRERLYTDTFTSDVPAGHLSPEWSARLGIRESAKVAVGLIDCHSGAVGSGIRANDLVMVCGTSTCDILVSPDRNLPCIPGICGQVDGSVIPGMTGLEAGQASFGDVYAWFKRFLSYGGAVSLPQLEKEAMQIHPGASSVFALDWLNGRRTPNGNQHLTGAIGGITLATTPPQVYRALAESTVFGARAILDHFKSNGISVQRILMTGGISRKSPFIMQMCADVFQREIQIISCDQTGALGAAVFGAAAAGYYPSVEAAMEKMSSGYDKVYSPDKNNSEIYEKLYKNYRIFGNTMERDILI